MKIKKFFQNKNFKSKFFIPISVIAAVILIFAVALLLMIFPKENSVSLPDDIGTVKDIRYSDIMNRSPVISDDNFTYFIGGGGDYGSFIAKFSENPNEYEKIYNTESRISCLNEYGGKLYFITSVNGGNYVCSADKSGGSFSSIQKTKGADGLFVFGEKAYYSINHFGYSGTGGAVYMVNLETNDTKNITVADNSEIKGILEYESIIYILYFDYNDSGKGHIMTFKSENTEENSEFKPLNEKDADIAFITVSEGKMYFTAARTSGTDYIYTLYSSNPDGSNLKTVASNCGKTVLIYGRYVYYNSSPSLVSSGTSKSLYRIRTDGKDPVSISEVSMRYFGISGEVIYYCDPDDYGIWSINIDGSGKKRIK